MEERLEEPREQGRIAGRGLRWGMERETAQRRPRGATDGVLTCLITFGAQNRRREAFSDRFAPDGERRPAEPNEPKNPRKRPFSREKGLERLARPTGFEPVAFGSGGRRPCPRGWQDSPSRIGVRTLPSRWDNKPLFTTSHHSRSVLRDQRPGELFASPAEPFNPGGVHGGEISRVPAGVLTCDQIGGRKSQIAIV